MADLQELQQQLNNIEELLALIVQVSDEKVPQLRKDIEQIIGKIQTGIDVQRLKEKVQVTIDNAIESGNYTKILATAKEIKEAVNDANRAFSDYEKEVKSISTWHTGLTVGAICFVLGAGVMWGWQYSRIDKYQYAIDQTNAMAGYINSDCKIKQSYAKFVGQTINCDQNWSSPTTILEKRKSEIK